jgi:N6-adenosine-specific RNA methylase IME4
MSAYNPSTEYANKVEIRPIKWMADVREAVLANSEERMPRWKFRLDTDLLVQIQPKPVALLTPRARALGIERRLLKFEGTGIMTENATPAMLERKPRGPDAGIWWTSNFEIDAITPDEWVVHRRGGSCARIADRNGFNVLFTRIAEALSAGSGFVEELTEEKLLSQGPERSRIDGAPNRPRVLGIIIAARAVHYQSQSRRGAPMSVSLSTGNDRARLADRGDDHAETSPALLDDLIATGKRFPAIYADGPWHFQSWANGRWKGDGSVFTPAKAPEYNTMSVQQIAIIPVHKVAADDCVLFMWGIWVMLPEVLHVIDAWGFKYKTCAFNWTKADVSQVDMFRDSAETQLGLGYWVRQDSEFCLLATRGRPKRRSASVRQGIIERRREHSRKPDCVYDRIERLIDGPYLELLARSSPRSKLDSVGQRGGEVQCRVTNTISGMTSRSQSWSPMRRCASVSLKAVRRGFRSLYQSATSGGKRSDDHPHRNQYCSPGRPDRSPLGKYDLQRAKLFETPTA